LQVEGHPADAKFNPVIQYAIKGAREKLQLTVAKLAHLLQPRPRTGPLREKFGYVELSALTSPPPEPVLEPAADSMRAYEERFYAEEEAFSPHLLKTPTGCSDQAPTRALGLLDKPLGVLDPTDVTEQESASEGVGEHSAYQVPLPFVGGTSPLRASTTEELSGQALGISLLSPRMSTAAIKREDGSQSAALVTTSPLMNQADLRHDNPMTSWLVWDKVASSLSAHLSAHQTPWHPEGLQDGQWLSNGIISDFIYVMCEVSGVAAHITTVSRGLMAGKRPAVRLGMVNTQLPPELGYHWLFVATVRSNGKLVVVEIDPLNPSPPHNSSVHPSTKAQFSSLDIHEWLVGWNAGMEAILEHPGLSLGDPPVLQHGSDTTECGVWVLMMVNLILAVLSGKVEVPEAMQSVRRLGGDVRQFRRHLQTLP